MTVARRAPSGRRDEVLEASYQHALEIGTTDLALRPMAAAVGSSAGVLVYLFGSKDGLVQALLERARRDELALLASLPESSDLAGTAQQLWRWLAAPQHRPLLRLWVRSYGHSLTDSTGPWAGFAQASVDDWLEVLAASQPPRRRGSRRGAVERSYVLALLRGALLDLLTTGDEPRCTAAVREGLATVGPTHR